MVTAFPVTICDKLVFHVDDYVSKIWFGQKLIYFSHAFCSEEPTYYSTDKSPKEGHWNNGLTQHDASKSSSYRTQDTDSKILHLVKFLERAGCFVTTGHIERIGKPSCYNKVTQNWNGCHGITDSAIDCCSLWQVHEKLVCTLVLIDVGQALPQAASYCRKLASGHTIRYILLGISPWRFDFFLQVFIYLLKCALAFKNPPTFLASPCIYHLDLVIFLYF